MTVKVHFEDVEVGDEMPAWSRTTNFMHWNRYAAVNDEFVPFHMDDEDGRKAGNAQGAFGMGNLRYAYLVNALHRLDRRRGARSARSAVSTAPSTRRTTP